MTPRKDLRKCQPGDCDIKLGADAMEIAKKVDWKAPDARTRVTGLLKQAMVDGVNAYLARGTVGLYVRRAAHGHDFRAFTQER